MYNTSNSQTSAAVGPVPKLAIEGLTKRYGNGVLANDAVSLQVAPSTIHAIVGENGAGKSTVLKMLYGLERADAGSILLDGRVCHFRRPADAIAAGIGLVPQHLKLIPSMTVAENVVLGAEPVRGLWLDRSQMRAEVLALSRQHGLAVDVDARVDTLAVGAQQRVEILKALRRGASLLLLDEPTALLTPQETQALFQSLRALAQAQLTVILITHKMAEVRAVCDSFTVMRAARVVGGGRATECSEAQIAEMIVGRTLAAPHVQRVDARAMPARVKARNLTLLRPGGRPELLDVSFDVAPGEILGIAGVEGNGQNRIAEILGGVCEPTLGGASMDGVTFTGQGARHARTCKVGHVPEDRLHGGVAPSMSIAENCAALDYRAPPIAKRGVLNLHVMRQRGREMIERFTVRARDEAVQIGTLSGGNIQKIVVGRELLAQPRFLIANQPTRGVDLGAAQSLRQEIVGLRNTGSAVLLVSADLDEVFELSDRIAVLFEGRIVAHFMADQVSQQVVGRYMTGLQSDDNCAALLGSPLTQVDHEVLA